MARPIKASQSEIDDVANWAAEAASEGKRNFPGMSYEEGVDATLRWLFDGGERPDTE